MIFRVSPKYRLPGLGDALKRRLTNTPATTAQVCSCANQAEDATAS